MIMKISISTIGYEHAGRECVRTMYMFNENTKEHQSAIKQFLEMEERVLNPKNELDFELAKAFITAGGKIIEEVKSNVKQTTI